MYGLVRKALFAASPEAAHGFALDSLKAAHALGATKVRPCPAGSPVQAMGLSFPNAVGLSAGMDKNGDYIDALGSLGFGFIEVGTVTPRPQAGNPKPRVFRLEEAGALINRLGFNNKGVDHLVARARRRRYKGILGINIGKNAVTPIENAVDDYLYCLDKVYPVADYITINISSPNTKNLRDLQSAEALNALLAAVNQRRIELSEKLDCVRPIAVKIAPDLDTDQIEEIARLTDKHEFDAVIATNTTLDRSKVQGLPHYDEAGGLSGEPLKEQSDRVLGLLRTALPDHIALVGVGGISSEKDAADKRALGADLVQIYTGFIYQGPTLVAQCIRAMS